MMKRLFNTAGPCIPGEHYLIPTLARCPELAALIQGRSYFVIHAARQAGKTTLLKALATEINAVGERAALYCSLESVQGLTEPERGIPAVVRALQDAIRWSPVCKGVILPVPDFANYSMGLKVFLADLCFALGKPLVLLFDEADCLSNQTLISFLRQLRDGFVNRADTPFPSSIALVGMRDIRDYKAKIRHDNDTLGSASPFNIITESLTLKNFTYDEIGILYAQHTAETGQPFTPEAVDRASHWTGGQPWLVNAIARECVEKILQRDLSKPVTAELVNQAAENLLRRRDTHLDSLYERLKEERVRRVVEPVILGRATPEVSLMSDDTQYVLDLGLLRQEHGALLPANPIYAEVIARTLSYDTQMAMLNNIRETPWIRDGYLDMTGLLQAFQVFWRENSGIWMELYQYKEAAPHLIMMAFLQRVINGGGQMIREYSLGRRRLDLCIIYAGQRYPVELKLWEGPKSKEEGMTQLAAYCDSCGTTEGWLVFFDRRPKRPWSKKILWQTRHDAAGHTLHFVGC